MTVTSSVHDEVNYEALNRKLKAMNELSEKVLTNISKHIEYFEKKYESLTASKTGEYEKEKIMEKANKDILVLQKMKDNMKKMYNIELYQTNKEKLGGDSDLSEMLQFLQGEISKNAKALISINGDRTQASVIRNHIMKYMRQIMPMDKQIQTLKQLTDKYQRDKRIDDTYRTVNEMNGRMINQAAEFSSGQQTCSIDKYNKINEKKNNNLVKSLFNSTIGRLYLDWLGFEKGAISSALNGLTRSQEVVGENKNAKEILDAVEAKLSEPDGMVGSNKNRFQGILRELGIIYGTFMVLLKRVLQDTGGDLETIAFEKAFDIVGGVAEGSFKGIMHAIGQIPPFGVIFSVLSMIDAAVSGVAKTAATGMMVLDPILDIFNASTGYDTDEFKSLIRNIGDIKNVLMSGSSPNAGLLADSAYVDCKR